jgi:ABC-type phosphate transport system auxiliary subunit
MTEPVKDAVEETQRGRSSRTPWLALTGVTLAVSVLVVVVLVIVVIAFLLAR